MPIIYLESSALPNTSFPVYDEDRKIILGRGLTHRDDNVVNLIFDTSLSPERRSRYEELIENEELKGRYCSDVNLDIGGAKQRFEGVLLVHSIHGPES